MAFLFRTDCSHDGERGWRAWAAMADTPWDLLDGADVDMGFADSLKMTTPEPDSPLTTFGQGVPQWGPAGEEVASDEGGGGDGELGGGGSGVGGAGGGAADGGAERAATGPQVRLRIAARRR